MNSILTMSQFIFPLITFPYVSRILLPIGTGKVSFATSVISYFAMFAQLGIPTYGIRACAKVRDNRKKLSKTAQEIFIINIIMSIIAYFVFILALCNVQRLNDEKTLFIIVSLTIFFNAIGMEWLYKALEQYTYITIRSVIFKFIALIAMFLLIKQQSDYIVYGAISIFASSASNIFNFINVHKYIDLHPCGNYNLKKHLKAVAVFFAMSCATTIYTHLDTVMLGFMKTDADVGYYNAGKTVLVVDKRPNIGGNIFTEKQEGINVHKYGAHIFHTNNKKVWRYITQFAEFNRFTNSPVANYKGELFSMPFNMYTFNKMWGVVTPEEAAKKIEEQRKEITGEPQNLEEQAISLVGRDIYEKLVKGYTEKQWGRDCKDLPAFIIKRLPVRLTFDNNYFNALYQGIPMGGYTKMVEKILEGIEVRLNTDYLEHRKELDALAKKIVYTGPIDAFFNYKLGTLEYRSVRFENETLDISNFQGNAAVNYTDRETPWTRIIEHKWFEFGKDEEGNEIPKTIISREFSSEWKPGDEAYYPVNDEKNSKLYAEYKKLADAEKKVIFGGRLGEYKYYDMDAVIASVLEMCEREIK